MRIGILADIHANLDALQAVIQDGRSAVDRWWVLGDVLGRGPQPVEVLLLLRDQVDTRHWLIGNHDAYVMGLLEPGDGTVSEADRFTWQDHRRQLQAYRAANARPRLWEWCRRTWTWQRATPQWIKGIEDTQPDYCLVHAALGDELTNIGDRPRFSYILPWQNIEHRVIRNKQYERLQAQRRDERTVVLIYGHTHVPYLEAQVWHTTLRTPLPIRYGVSQRLDQFDSVLINPGSVGQPRNGDPLVHAAYGILDTDASTFEFRRVPYDSERTRLAMAKLNYDLSLIYMLVGNHCDHPLRRGNSMWKDWQRTYEERPWGWEPILVKQS